MRACSASVRDHAARRQLRIIRVKRIELLHEAIAVPVKVGDFEVPPEAARHPAVLSAMITPALSVNADLHFALVPERP